MYKLRKAPKKDLYWVVNVDTKKKHSVDPIPKEKAEAQLRILEQAMVEKGEVVAKKPARAKRGGMRPSRLREAVAEARKETQAAAPTSPKPAAAPISQAASPYLSYSKTRATPSIREQTMAKLEAEKKAKEELQKAKEAAKVEKQRAAIAAEERKREQARLKAEEEQHKLKEIKELSEARKEARRMKDMAHHKKREEQQAALVASEANKYTEIHPHTYFGEPVEEPESSFTYEETAGKPGTAPGFYVERAKRPGEKSVILPISASAARSRRLPLGTMELAPRFRKPEPATKAEEGLKESRPQSGYEHEALENKLITQAGLFRLVNDVMTDKVRPEPGMTKEQLVKRLYSSWYKHPITFGTKDYRGEEETYYEPAKTYIDTEAKELSPSGSIGIRLQSGRKADVDSAINDLRDSLMKTMTEMERKGFQSYIESLKKGFRGYGQYRRQLLGCGDDSVDTEGTDQMDDDLYFLVREARAKQRRLAEKSLKDEKSIARTKPARKAVAKTVKKYKGRGKEMKGGVKARVARDQLGRYIVMAGEPEMQVSAFAKEEDAKQYIKEMERAEFVDKVAKMISRHQDEDYDKEVADAFGYAIPAADARRLRNERLRKANAELQKALSGEGKIVGRGRRTELKGRLGMLKASLAEAKAEGNALKDEVKIYRETRKAVGADVFDGSMQAQHLIELERQLEESRREVMDLNRQIAEVETALKNLPIEHEGGSKMHGGDLNSVGQTIADVGQNVIFPGINKVVPGLGTVLQKTGDVLTGLFTPQSDIDAYNAQQAANAESRAKIAAENQYWADQAAAGNPNAAMRLPSTASRADVRNKIVAMGFGKVKKDNKWIQEAVSEMKEGAFTKQSLRKGETPLEYAKEVLAHPEKHTLTTRRRAQFLVNITKEKKSKKTLKKGKGKQSELAQQLGHISVSKAQLKELRKLRSEAENPFEKGAYDVDIQMGVKPTLKAQLKKLKSYYHGYGAMPNRAILHKVAIASYDKTAPAQIENLQLVGQTPTLKFYKGPDNTIVVGIRGTEPSDVADVKADALIGIGQLDESRRFKDDLNALQQFQLAFPPSQNDYYGVGHSLGGAILDRLLAMGLLKEGVSYNPAVEPQNLSAEMRNARIYNEEDPLYKLMGKQLKQKAEVRTARKRNWWERIVEKVPYAGKAYNLYKAHQLENFTGGGKHKDEVIRLMQEALKKHPEKEDEIVKLTEDVLESIDMKGSTAREHIITALGALGTLAGVGLTTIVPMIGLPVSAASGAMALSSANRGAEIHEKKKEEIENFRKLLSDMGSERRRVPHSRVRSILPAVPTHKEYSPDDDLASMLKRDEKGFSEDEERVAFEPQQVRRGKGKGGIKAQLKGLRISPALYLREAQKRAKEFGYPEDALEFSDDDKKKLQIHDGDGNVVRFGAVGYGDHIIYSILEKRKRVAKGTAAQKKDRFVKSHTEIKGDWEQNPYSPNMLALSVLW